MNQQQAATEKEIADLGEWIKENAGEIERIANKQNRHAAGKIEDLAIFMAADLQPDFWDIASTVSAKYYTIAGALIAILA